jgi:ribonuclease-3
VLGLAISDDLYPRFEADRYGAGRMTRVRAQAVSGRSCAAVAQRLGLPGELLAAAPAGGLGQSAEALVRTERVLASVLEAVIGACHLEHGYDRTAAAVVQAFAPEVRVALADPVDPKSALQELLARRGDVVSYEVAEERGPPHERTFDVVARVRGEEVGRGSGRSKKDAEQAAAGSALDGLGG